MTAEAGQRRLLGRLLAELRPQWRRDAALPARIERRLRRERGCGARDRRLQRELLYTAVRYLPWIEPLLDAEPARAEEAVAWLAADIPATRPFRAAVAGAWPPCPEGAAAKAAVLGADPDALLPSWLRAERPEAFEPAQRDALLSRAPLWVRLQADDPAPVLAEWQERGWRWLAADGLAGAFALPPDADLASTEGYRSGRAEIQDLGSQLVLESVGIEPGGRWLDACAGAGGKSLQLARLLGERGRVEAHDVRPEALAELELRAARAGLGRRIARRAAPRGPYDGVLVDAPCTGSGTWRRAPHLKWTTRPGDPPAHARRQRALLDGFAPLVRPGGRLVYATCSLCRSENEAVADAFLGSHPAFAPAAFARAFSGERRGPGLAFLPAGHDGDGFYVASFRRL